MAKKKAEEKATPTPFKSEVEPYSPVLGEKCLFTSADGEFVGEFTADGRLVKHSIRGGCQVEDEMENGQYTLSPLTDDEVFQRLAMAE